MPCSWRLCLWLVSILLVASFTQRWAWGDPRLFGLGPLDLVLLSLIPVGAHRASRHHGPRWAFTVYGAAGGAGFVPATLLGAESSFRTFSDRRAATVTEYILLWVALVIGPALLCGAIGRSTARKAVVGKDDLSDIA